MGTYYYGHAGPPMAMVGPPQPPPIYAPPPHTRHAVWLMPLIFLAEIGLFVYTMYENNCPQHRGVSADRCVLEEELGRYSFEPISENSLLGPSSTTLIKLGALKADLVYKGQYWRLFASTWLHGGVLHLLINMVGVLMIGNRFENEFGFWRVGPLYVICGIGGSLISVLQLVEKKRNVISVGASGSLFGLLGATLSELMTNWSCYSDKCAQIFSLFLVIGLNVAVTFMIPWIDTAAHVGGFITGYLLGFILLMKPRPGYISRRYLPPGYQQHPRYKLCQYFFFVLALVAFVALFAFFVSELEIKRQKWLKLVSSAPVAKQ